MPFLGTGSSPYIWAGMIDFHGHISPRRNYVSSRPPVCHVKEVEKVNDFFLGLKEAILRTYEPIIRWPVQTCGGFSPLFTSVSGFDNS